MELAESCLVNNSVDQGWRQENCGKSFQFQMSEQQYSRPHSFWCFCPCQVQDVPKAKPLGICWRKHPYTAQVLATTEGARSATRMSWSSCTCGDPGICDLCFIAYCLSEKEQMTKDFVKDACRWFHLYCTGFWLKGEERFLGPFPQTKCWTDVYSCLHLLGQSQQSQKGKKQTPCIWGLSAYRPSLAQDL